MIENKAKLREQLAAALAAYTGPTTKCRAGEARGKVVNFRDAADRWISSHRHSPLIKDEKAERRRVRSARAQRERIAKRNAAIKKRIGEVES